MIPGIEYASMFAYSPRGIGHAHAKSRDLTYDLKEDKVVRNNITASEMIACAVRETAESTTSLFAGYFGERCTLVPVPRSGLHRPGTLWVPWNLASHMSESGLGRDAVRLVKRVKAVPRASRSPPGQRPLARKHYDTVEVMGPMHEIGDIILVDDVVTSGATILGVASRLAERFPDSEIKAFAAVRTISDDAKFVNLAQPARGRIALRGEYTTRRP